MGCPYYGKDGSKARCGASISNMTPCVCDAAFYCATEEHYRCPILLSHVLRGGAGWFRA